ncbi:MAG: hypothetical protein LUB59_04810, partial [Candidatus Gastranaerophilales bacterium]|nr:hypothetical protein [Candidatus Gastranaerophilales bacterium]
MALFQNEIIENNQQNEIEERSGWEPVPAAAPADDDPISKKYGKELQKLYADREKRYNEEVENARNYYKNFYSDEKRKEWENKGQMSFMEVWQKADKWSLIPYAGTAKQAYEAFSLKNTADKIRKGTALSADEKKEFDDYLADIGEMQARGFTFGGRTLDMTLQTIPFMAEFAVGALTTGGGASFLSAAAKAGTKSALRNISLGAAEEIAKNGIAKTVAKGAAKTALNTLNPKTYAFSLTRLPQQVALRIGEQQLHDSIAITPEGQLILQEAKDKPAIAFFKALQLVNIETASEFSGDMLVRPALYGLGKLASPILKKLPKGLLTNFKKAAEKALNIPFTKALDRYGFNGILEEMGEERVGDVLKYMFNLDDKEGYDFKQLLNAVFPAPDDLLAEFISFGIAGAGMHAAVRGAGRGVKDYTADDFLVDSGIIRTAGEQSLVDSAVEKQLIKQGKSDEEINEILRYADNNMKKNFLSDQEKYNRAETVEEVKNVIKHIYKSNDANITEHSAPTASGFDDKKLDEISSVLAAVIDVQARKTGKSIEETAETYLPSIAQLKGYVYADENGNGITGEDIQNAIDKLKQNLGELHENDGVISTTLREPENMEAMDKILSDIGILENMLNGNLPDEHQQRALDLIMGSKQETDNAEVHHQSAAMKRNLFDDFKDFYNDVLAKPKNTDDKRQFNAKTKDGLYLRIPHDVILHEHGKHKLTIDEWKDLLENIDNVSISIRSRQKSRFSGKAVLLKIKTSNNTFGVVIEAFQRKNPIIATTFTDTEKNVDHWIKEEAISSGTKTSFLSNRLYNIITSLQPKYKPFNPNVKKSEGNTYFQPADMYSNNADNMFNPALNLPVDNNDFNLKLKKIQNPSANMKNLLTQGYYPEEYIVPTLPGNTKDGKKIKQALEENKEYKKNYQLKYEYEGAKSYWSEKDNKLVDSELVYFDTKEKLGKFLEKIKKDKNFKRVMTIEEVDEWHHVNRSGKNKLIN